jgi:alpha/beta superfamily hydrolase
MNIFKQLLCWFIVSLLSSSMLSAEAYRKNITFRSIGVDSVKLEGVLSYNSEKPCAPAVILCHPHPDGGGAMDIPAYLELEKYLYEAGFTILGFNFRGVGKSEGAFGDGGRGEEDLKGAVRYIMEHPKLKPEKLFLFGYSYGSGIAFYFTLKDKRIAGSVLLGFPTTYMINFNNYEGINNPKAPMHIIIGSNDGISYGMKSAVTKFVLKTYQHVKLTILPGANHTFYKFWKGIFHYTSSFHSDILSGEINKRKSRKEHK